jgi:hypothetical protein
MRRVVCVVVPVVLVLSGCMTLGPVDPKAGLTTFAFKEGWGAQGFPFAVEKVRDVAIEGMGDLKMHSIHQSTMDRTALVLDGQVHDGRHIRVAVRPGGLGSLVTARVGRFGDEALSRALMERIGVRLGTLPPAAIPEVPPTSPPRLPFSRSAVPDARMLRDQADEVGYRDAHSPLSLGP